MQVNYRTDKSRRSVRTPPTLLRSTVNELRVLFINASTRLVPLIPLKRSSSIESGDAISSLATVRANLRWIWNIPCD